MVERICQHCAAGNPPDGDVCLACGVRLDHPLAVRGGTALSLSPAMLPQRWQRAGKALALGAVALAVEVGAAWLKQRGDARPAPLARRSVERAPSGRTRVVARQRVWETYEHGRLSQRVVEQTLWQMPESGE